VLAVPMLLMTVLLVLLVLLILLLMLLLVLLLTLLLVRLAAARAALAVHPLVQVLKLPPQLLHLALQLEVLQRRRCPRLPQPPHLLAVHQQPRKFAVLERVDAPQR